MPISIISHWSGMAQHHQAPPQIQSGRARMGQRRSRGYSPSGQMQRPQHPQTAHQGDGRRQHTRRRRTHAPVARHVDERKPRQECTGAC